MAQNYPENFQNLINILKTLPGIGNRSAERIAFSMLKWPSDKLKNLGSVILELREKTTLCPICGNLSSGGGFCGICSSVARDRTVICVVEESSQIQNIENSGLYKGVYHVLGGKLSPLESKCSKNLNLEPLLNRIDSDKVKEVIVALGHDMEGQATASYIAELLKDKFISVTRLAQGLPAGSDIAYADAATIAAALNGRRPLSQTPS